MTGSSTRSPWGRRVGELCCAALLICAACTAGDDPAAGPADLPASGTRPVPVPSPGSAPAQTAGSGRAARLPPAGCDDPPGCYLAPQRTGRFDPGLLTEASGLAAGVRNRVLYVVDDGPGTTTVFALRPDGRLVARLALRGVVGLDTEGLAVAPCGPDDARTCVYVGDMGGNFVLRQVVQVWRFPEPDLRDGPPEEPLPVDVARLSYPGRPADAEALLVDDRGRPALVTKEVGRGGTRLYRADAFTDGPLRALATLRLDGPASDTNVVTAGDSRGGRVLLRTYSRALEFIAPSARSPLSQLASWSQHEVPVHDEPQGEAIAYATDRCGYYTVSETVGDIWFTGCR